MKKYIRTINSIYQNDPSHIRKVIIIEKNCEESPCLEINLGYSAYGFPMTRYEKIIKESDTIKELCDVFVIDNNIYSKEDWEKKTKESKDYILKTRTVYGAIWVKDKGLIFTAKMDEEENLNYYEN